KSRRSVRGFKDEISFGGTKAGHLIISPSFNLEIEHGCGAETHYRRRIVFSGANRIRRALNGQRRQIISEGPASFAY
ncbi:hypothetical protein AB9E09_35255, partial [Rhizobium leguminosarum]|uniref:hypothetical protein n=1 Tax=Rhizobium leguminosarum TaxID=384 RepID=UPI003F9C2E06